MAKPLAFARGFVFSYPICIYDFHTQSPDSQVE
jgi:hypothetical protein